MKELQAKRLPAKAPTIQITAFCLVHRSSFFGVYEVLESIEVSCSSSPCSCIQECFKQ